jgi:hypothetical protein
MASLFFVALNASAVPILTSDAVDFIALTDTPVIVGTMYDADLNDDEKVDMMDLFIFKAAFGSYIPEAEAHDADLNDDGSVNFADLAMFKAAFVTSSAYLVTSSAYQGGTTEVIDSTGTSSSNVSLSEPATLGMFAIGLGLAIGFRRLSKAG